MARKNNTQKKKQSSLKSVQQPSQQMAPYKPPQKPKVSIPKALLHNVCGLVDPFCEHARGCKYPDSSSVKTLPYTQRYRQVINTDVNGYANCLIIPQFSNYPFCTAAAYAANAVTAWNGLSTSVPIASASNYRIVSAGVKIRHIVSPLSASGMIYIRQFGVEAASTLTTLTTTTYNATSALDVPVQDAKEICVVLQHTSQMPQVFYPLSSDTDVVANVTCKGFTPLTISLAGAAASIGVLELEIITHYELIFQDSTDLAQVATPAPAANAVVTSMASTLTSTITPIVNSSVESFGKYIVGRAAAAFASYIGGPAAGYGVRSALALTVD